MTEPITATASLSRTGADERTASAAPMGEAERRSLKRAFGAFPTGVTVVTTWHGGEPRGFTANSFTSVSIDPPLLLVCHAHGGSSGTAFADAQGFAVNILSAEQEAVAMRFASKIPDRFATIAHERGRNGPLIEGCASWLDCAMERTVNAGDHTILIGRVERHAAHGLPPLAYWNGQFHHGL